LTVSASTARAQRGALHRLARDFEALRHYLPEQIVGRAWIAARRRATTLRPHGLRRDLEERCTAPPPVRAFVVHEAVREILLRPEVTPPERAHDLLAGRFRLLGEAFDYGERPDWRFAQKHKPSHLGRMTLHYHRFVLDAVAEAIRRPESSAALLERVTFLLHDWKQACPPGERSGWGDVWNTYAAATRVLNARLARMLLSGIAGPDARRLERVLDAQGARDARFVARFLEWDLLGNHLLRDAVALVAAGEWFAGGLGREWAQLGATILRAELPRQVLADGLHEERSAMYQSLLIEDLLSAAFCDRRASEAGEALAPTLARLLGALGTLTHPDGEIALFNDACFGTACSPAVLTAWAGAFGVTPAEPPARDLRHAGYYRVGTSPGAAIFDAGLLGPDHLPAHAHCDALSFEWSFGGERVVTDTGVDRYEAGPERDFQRSTAAHSTLQVDGREQAEPFGSFRMGRRPRVTGHRLDERSAEGRHDGFGDGAIHRRILSSGERPALRWVDSVAGEVELPVTIRTALAPGCAVSIVESVATIRTAQGRGVVLRAPADGTLTLAEGQACERFGEARARPVLVWRGVGGRERAHEFRLHPES